MQRLYLIGNFKEEYKMKAIDKKELFVEMKELEEERGIKKDYLL